MKNQDGAPPDIGRINEEIAAGFARIAEAIGSAGGIPDLFETVIRRTEEAFAIPFVWLSLLRTPEADPVANALTPIPFFRDRLSLIAEEAFLECTGGVASPVLANENLRPFYRLLPPHTKYLIRSLAVAPFTRNGRVIGSINHGDPSADRYRRDMDATLLARMAARISGELERLLTREERTGADS